MTKWQEVRLGDVCKFQNGKKRPKEPGKYPVFGGNGILDYTNQFNSNVGVIVGRVGAYCGSVFLSKEKCWVSDNAILGINTSDTDIIYLYYLLKSLNLNAKHIGSGQPLITQDILNNIKIFLPPLDVQKKIAGVLGALDDKIELNNKINNNLEQQAQALFNEMFLEDMVSVHSKHHLPLSELVQNIDNRGKTPPLSPKKTDFPIIDVKALSGNTRIINYDNCTKFVSQETYLTGFRNGLPQKYDILLSTVGSLGEMKLFIEPKGCIAQNVIGYRSKISPLYLYQYLKTIKNDLLAYDIGSVQPSIKVTHIAKHPIFVPDKNKLKEFHGIAEAITNKIYINSQENTRLSALRDTLLPKLMSGEIDVSKVDINE